MREGQSLGCRQVYPGTAEEGMGVCRNVWRFEAGCWRAQVGGAHWLADRPPVAAPLYADGEPREVEAVIDVRAQYDVLPGGTLRLLYNVDASRALPAKLPPGLFGCVSAHPSQIPAPGSRFPAS